jgi:thiol:disulfide interchange protein
VKTVLPGLLLCFMTSLLHAQPATGVTFFAGSWPEALAEAKRQNKPLFLDLYTSWCPPCGRMAREAFPNARVGEKYNARFVNYQVNAEYGAGIDLARTYGVASYPTVLYIAPNGELMQRSVGYTGINGLLTQADMALAIPKLRKYLARGAKAARAYQDSLRRLEE